MASRTFFKMASCLALALGGVGTLLSAWASDKEQDIIIEEKVNEALAVRENEEAEES